MKKIGIFGGTFDPIHNGHLAAAQAALEALDLERIIFVPAGHPPHKRGRVLTEAGHRLAMVKLAIRDNKRFQASAAELDSDNPSFTVNTLERMASSLGKCRLHLIIGMDQALQLDTWRHPEKIFALAEVDVLTRPGYRPADLNPRWLNRIRMVEIPELDISSSRVRRLAKQGRSIAHLVPAPVAAYIRRIKLYRAAKTGKRMNIGKSG
jgi:nicotinate-nucleotide adenylyltransferase